MKRNPTVDVIIPAYKPEAGFSELLHRLEQQTYRVGHILVINTEESYWDPKLTDGCSKVEVFHISKKEFDHGGTRDMGAGFSNADIILFMTQDAMPKDGDLVYQLVRAFRDPKVGAAYARQVPNEHCQIIEGYIRSFNYPREAVTKTQADLKQYGIKTYFCSNVCAAYDHALYRKMGGFTRPCIFNEDMIYGGRIIRLGYAVAYVPEAVVIHSHNYGNREQFHRYFDNGVSQAMHPEIFRNVPSAGEGMKLVKKTGSYLKSIDHAYLLPHLYWQSACKFLGFRLGKMYRHLPRAAVRALSWNKAYWDWHPDD